MSKRKSPASANQQHRNRNITVAVVALIGAVMLCSGIVVGGGVWLFNQATDVIPTASDAGPAWAPDSAELTVAVSPVMAPVFVELVAEFNAQNQQTPDGQTMQVTATVAEPEQMVAAALDNPPFQAMSPDSSLWLDRLEQRWATQTDGVQADSQIPIGQRRVSEQTRYAVSPIVIAAWESVARALGWPDKAIGWEDIQRQATRDENFKWNHPSTNTAAGFWRRSPSSMPAPG